MRSAFSLNGSKIASSLWNCGNSLSFSFFGHGINTSTEKIACYFLQKALTLRSNEFRVIAFVHLYSVNGCCVVWNMLRWNVCFFYFPQLNCIEQLSRVLVYSVNCIWCWIWFCFDLNMYIITGSHHNQGQWFKIIFRRNSLQCGILQFSFA